MSVLHVGFVFLCLAFAGMAATVVAAVSSNGLNGRWNTVFNVGARVAFAGWIGLVVCLLYALAIYVVFK